jgi:competence protein ComEC
LKRPSVALICAFWTGLVASGNLPLPLEVLVVVFAILVAVLLIARPRRVAVIVFLAGVFLLGVLRSPEAAWNCLEPVKPAPGRNKFPCILKVSASSWLPVCGERVRVRVEDVSVGYTWLEGRDVYLMGPNLGRAFSDGMATAIGTFYAPRPRLNPYGWDAAERCKREGVAGTVIVNRFADPPRHIPWLAQFRDRISKMVSSAGTRSTRGVLGALLLGQRSDIDPLVKDLMIRAGTYHVMAISGLHVGIVVLLVSSVITAAAPPRGLRIFLAAVCVFAYVVFTGARPSAQRAGTFFALLSLVRYLEWKVDIPNLVCAAGTVLLVASPHLAWDVGFKLSLGAVFGITLLVPGLDWAGTANRTFLGRLRRYVVLGVLASFSAQVATLPILLYHFGRISLMGVVSNLVVLPLVTLAVAAGLEASICVLFWERLGVIFMRSASALITCMIEVTSASTCWVDPVVFSGRPGILRLVIYVAGITYLGLLRPRLRPHWKIVALLMLCVLLVLPVPPRATSNLVLTFIHVGDGDACLIRFPHGRTMLIDTGTGSSEYDAGRFDVLPTLAMQGIKRVDTVLITHSHSDHYGGLGSLVGNIDVGRVVVGTDRGEAGYLKVLESCRERGIELSVVGRGDTITCGAAALEILHPSSAYLAETISDPNAQSVVLRLVYGDTRILFTGDVTPEVKQELVSLGIDLACDVLKVPHHGAPDGLDRDFAVACGALYGVVSVGSRFPSHPCPKTIDLLERSGTRVFTTLNDGAITVITDGRSMKIRTEVLGWIDRGRRDGGLESGEGKQEELPVGHLLDAVTSNW